MTERAGFLTGVVLLDWCSFSELVTAGTELKCKHCWLLMASMPLHNTLPVAHTFVTFVPICWRNRTYLFSGIMRVALLLYPTSWLSPLQTMGLLTNTLSSLLLYIRSWLSRFQPTSSSFLPRILASWYNIYHLIYMYMNSFHCSFLCGSWVNHSYSMSFLQYYTTCFGSTRTIARWISHILLHCWNTDHNTDHTLHIKFFL
jgi:hypothetical protein